MCSASDMAAGSSMRECLRAVSRHAASDRGQATVEAAFALPILMVLMLLLLQPGILLYDRIVMQGAASDACRLMATTSDGSTNEDYVRRRLSAIPQIDQFHVHSSGCSWRIELEGGEGSEEVRAKVTTEVKPLPLLDLGMALGGMLNGNGNLELAVECSERTQPAWIGASKEGRDPSAWPGI